MIDGAGRPSVWKVTRLVGTAVRLLVRADRRLFLLAVGLQLASGLGTAALLLVGRAVLAAVLSQARGPGAVARVLPGLLGLTAISAAAGFALMAQQAPVRVLTERAVAYFQERIFEVSAAVDLEAFDRPEFYDSLQRAQSRSIQTPMSLTLALAGLASAVFAVGGLLVALFVLQPLLVPLVLIGYVPLWRATTRTGQRMYSFSFGATPGDRARQYLETVLTRRDPAKEVRAFSLAPMLTDRWRRLYDERIEEIRQRAREHVRRSAFASVGSAALNAVTLGVIVLLLLSERMSVAGAATAAIAIQLVGSRLQSATTGTSGLYENALYLEDFITFLRTPVEERAGGRPAPRGFDRLVVSNVSFSYPGADVPALRGVDLEIGAGEIVALVGENGSGKTTLAKLLCQLYRPERGRILWDGVDTATLDSRELRRSVAVIFQDFLKYQLPARDNIAAGLPERVHDLDAIREAARRSGAGLFLEAVGYDTILSKEFEGGTDLSVGQWQRVALARAFFRDAPFIVLDEPTAALDPRAEYELFQSIRELCAGRSVLLISHRFSSVRSADRIYVLESGRVTEHGSHAELMTRNGLYAELFTLQASAYLGDPAAEFQA